MLLQEESYTNFKMRNKIKSIYISYLSFSSFCNLCACNFFSWSILSLINWAIRFFSRSSCSLRNTRIKDSSLNNTATSPKTVKLQQVCWHLAIALINKPISRCIRKAWDSSLTKGLRQVVNRLVGSWLSKLVIHRLAASCFNKL